MKYKRLLLGAATVTTGLNAGLFYGYSTSVIPAFKQLGDSEYVHAMQTINKDIQNPLFFGIFFGAAVFLPLVTVLCRKSGQAKRYKLLAAATALYLIGTFGVTSTYNVPLNNTLDKVDIATATTAQLATARHDYESPWNNWHTVRTAANVAAFVCVVGAVLTKQAKQR